MLWLVNRGIVMEWLQLHGTRSEYDTLNYETGAMASQRPKKIQPE
jgi:hypothetical protein